MEDFLLFYFLSGRVIQNAKVKVSKTINKEMIVLYWHIGQAIVEKQNLVGYGKSVVEQLAKDIKEDFPNLQGFSARNMWDMRRFYLTYKDFPLLRQLVAEVPWKHNLLIMSMKNTDEQAFYLEQVATQNWTREVLTFQIKNNVYQNLKLRGKHHNFQHTLPELQANQAQEILKSEYTFDFLGIQGTILEKALENKLIEHIKEFLLELGYGFTFIGQQYRLVLGQKEYFIDLLFFHRKLKCLVAIDLKIGESEPEYAGKMNFYLEVLDNTVKMTDENSSIGIILCTKKDDLEVEYSLRSQNKPIGVAEYKLYEQLPEELSKQLPSAKEIKQYLKSKK
ncbi:MAG: PDDEXK nuclease domain-containing protein [Microscillaceae bacterium]|nr:PDDEXK nuclease domain-containing protein [Microscillaceae bacterium]